MFKTSSLLTVFTWVFFKYLMECFPRSSEKGRLSRGGKMCIPIAEPHSRTMGRYFSLSYTKRVIAWLVLCSNTTKLKSPLTFRSSINSSDRSSQLSMSLISVAICQDTRLSTDSVLNASKDFRFHSSRFSIGHLHFNRQHLFDNCALIMTISDLLRPYLRYMRLC